MRPYFRHESRLRHMCSLTLDSDWTSLSENQLRTFREEPKFQQTVFMCFQNFVSSNNGDSPAALNNFQALATDLGTETDIKEWDRILSKCLENMQLEDDDDNLKEFCLEMFDRLLHGNSGSLYDTSDFILCAQELVKTLVMSKPNVIGPVKKQLRNLEKMLEFILIIALAAEKKNTDEKLQKFMKYIQPWVNSAAAVPFVFWVNEVDEKLCTLLSSFLEKFNPGTPELVQLYLGAVKSLKASEELQESQEYEGAVESLKTSVEPDETKEGANEGSQETQESETSEKPEDSENSNSEESENSDSYESEDSYNYTEESDESESKVLLMRDALWRFIDILLQNLIVTPNDDRVETLSEVMVLLTAFLMDPPQAYAEEEKTMAQTNLLVDKAASLISSLSSGKLREDILEERNILLHGLQEKINNAKAELQDFHVGIPMLSRNNVPLTNRQGTFNLFLANLEKKVEAEADLFPFEKHQMAIVQKELMLLKPFLMDIFDFQDEHEELKNIWVRASNAAYLVDFVTDACLSFDLPIWSTIIHLSNSIEEIQLVKTQADKIRNNQMYSSTVLSAKRKSKLTITGREQADDTIMDDFKVDFMEEEEILINRLTGGVDEFDIVAIVGMPGQGKTTLARRVLHNPLVQNHFKKCAWCCISQAYDLKKILADILKGVGEPVPEEEISSLSLDDLANSLRKCLLKGGSYLIVLDDIWDIKPWKELRLSFPDNQGSRILFTSRNHNLALEAKRYSYVVELHPLTLEDSSKLLQLKLFGKEECPENLSDIAKIIAKNCKGLPLAIVLVAGLLKKDTSLESWKQVSQSLTSHIASESWCINILELSYNHLPEHLKPCFLYLGAFHEDQVIHVKWLMQLWIAEGFVQNDGTQSLEAVANEYLIKLVNSSLVSIAKRSSKYGIKRCRVHDLLHEFCIRKAAEERFLLVPKASDQSSITRYEPYRLCVNHERVPFFVSRPAVPSVRSLVFSSDSWFFPFNTPSSFTRFKLLKVLVLGRVLIRHCFDEITQLIHLRFLTVFCEKNIPTSIVNLMRLEYFNLCYVFLEGFLPSILLNRGNLRHIIVHGEPFIVYIRDGGEEMEKWQPLANLDTFTYFQFDDALFFEKVARKLPNVRKLGLKLGFCVHLSKFFNKLESLNLLIEKDISPSNFELPSTVKKLTLNTGSKELSINMLSSFGQLSNLEVLKLQANFEDGRWDVEDDEFLYLKYLEISNSNIQEWNVSDESFPRLQQLVFTCCRDLMELPSRFGELSTLKTIRVSECHKSISSSFQQIVDDQRDYGNEGLQFSISHFASS